MSVNLYTKSHDSRDSTQKNSLGETGRKIKLSDAAETKSAFWSLPFKGISFLSSLAKKKEDPLSLDKAIKEMVSAAGKADGPSELNNLVLKFLEKAWDRLSLPSSGKNEKNKEFLRRKLLTVLMTHKLQGSEQKIEICQNICKNFEHFLNDAFQQINSDLETDSHFREAFHIENQKIQSLELLGQETHRRGKVPLLIEFTSGLKVVLKPRSMAVEQVIFSQDKTSVFNALHLTDYTYVVYDKRTHGYSVFIENIEKENTLQSKEEMRAFINRYLILEKYLKPLGIGDLHSENLRVQRKFPIVIDAEVLSPNDSSAYETGLLSGATAGFLFSSDTGNRIWLSENLLQEVDPSIGEKLLSNDFVTFDSYELFLGLGILEGISGEQTELEPIEQKVLEEAKKELVNHMHRVILIDTSQLRLLIQDPIEKSFGEFMIFLEEGLSAWGFKFDRDQVKKIQAIYIENLKNNDVPVFYYHPASGAVFYENLEIGKMK